MRKILLRLLFLSIPINCSSPQVANIPPSSRQIDCTLIGCFDGANFSIQVSSALLQNPETTLQVCLNGICNTNKLSILKGNFSCNFPGPLTVKFCGLSVTQNDGGTDIVYVKMFIYNRLIKDGDVYAMEIFDSTGKTPEKIIIERQVVYQTSRPNGPNCEPLCYNTLIEGP